MKKKCFYSFSKREKSSCMGSSIIYAFFDRLRMFHPLFLIWTKLWHYFPQSYEYCSKLHITYVLACIKHVHQTVWLSSVQFSWVEFSSVFQKWWQGKKSSDYKKKLFPLSCLLHFIIIQVLLWCSCLACALLHASHTERQHTHVDSNKTFSIESLNLNFPLHV